MLQVIVPSPIPTVMWSNANSDQADNEFAPYPRYTYTPRVIARRNSQAARDSVESVLLWASKRMRHRATPITPAKR